MGLSWTLLLKLMFVKRLEAGAHNLLRDIYVRRGGTQRRGCERQWQEIRQLESEVSN